MDIERMTRYTSDLVKKLTGSRQYDLDPRIMQQIKEINDNPSESPRAKTWKTTVKGGKDFAIPKSVTSMPYISGITDGGDIELQTIEPATYKMSGGTPMKSTMVPTRLMEFRREIPKINKAAFGNGIDIDNFHVTNVSDQPMNKNNMKYLTQHGNVLPLGTNHGVFIPDFALQDATWMSAEFEGVFKGRDPGGEEHAKFDHYVTDKVKQTYGFNPKALLSHDAGSNFSYKAYNDGSYAAGRQGYHPQEVVFGAGPMSNVLFAMNSAFSAWDETGFVHEQDKIGSHKTGMHVSTTLSALNSNTKGAVSNYLKHAGVIFDALSRTKERWKSTNHLGIPSGAFSGARDDFRLGTGGYEGHNRLESRFPAAVMDIGHVANQFTIASKINTDAQKYIEAHSTERVQRTSDYAVTMSGQARAETNLFSKLHSSGTNTLKQWANSFMETMGIKSDFEKQFVVNMNKQCRQTGRR